MYLGLLISPHHGKNFSISADRGQHLEEKFENKSTSDPEIKCAGGENLFIGNLASLNEFSLSQCVFLVQSTAHINPAEIQ